MSKLLNEMFSCFKSHGRSDDVIAMKAQNERNKLITRELKRDWRMHSLRHHILLLGTGESGKSTFLKQMKIICGKTFSKTEIEIFKDTIYDNILKGILFLIDAKEQLDIEWEHEISEESAQSIEIFYQEMKTVFKERRHANNLMWLEEDFVKIVSDLKLIWSDSAIKDAFNRRNEIITESFSENTRYYLNKIDQIGVLKYFPSNEDIVWTRKPTECIIEEEFDMHDRSILVFIDVGGQTKERRKWCQFFQDMNSVLFLVACSHYDEEYIDRHTGQKRNKLSEALIVFEELINQDAFLRASVLLFFNKTDILIEKITHNQSDIRRDFHDFPKGLDPFNLVDVQSFIVESFTRLIDNPHCTEKMAIVTRTMSLVNNNNSVSTTIKPQLPKRTVYRHFTTAVDKGNIEKVFNAMKDTVLHNNIRKLMMN